MVGGGDCQQRFDEPVGAGKDGNISREVENIFPAHAAIYIV